MLTSFAFTNPHLTLKATLWEESYPWAATLPDWKKWRPSDPTSPHWYSPEHLARLASAYIALDAECNVESRTVRAFISEFRGLSSTGKQKAVLEATGLARCPLTALVKEGALDMNSIERLLKAMQQHSPAVNPTALGIIGKAHLETRFAALGCEMESFKYVQNKGESEGLPYIVETAFAWNPTGEKRQFVTGVNWSPGILNPFRELGRAGMGMDGILQDLRAGPNEPVILLLHLACARVNYSDRGKSSVVLEG